MRMLYFSLVNSHLLYGILVCGYECHRLKKIQKRIIRMITVSKYNAHTEPLFKGLDLLKLKDMLNLSTLKILLSISTRQFTRLFLLISNPCRTQRTLYADKRVQIYLLNMVNSILIPLLQKNATQSPGFLSKHY